MTPSSPVLGVPVRQPMSNSVSPIIQRPRRLRRTATLRRLVRENTLAVEDLIYPLFVMEGEELEQEIPSMPGCFRYSLDRLLTEIQIVWELVVCQFSICG